MKREPPVGGEGAAQKSGVPESLPADFGARAAIILDLARSPFHHHFLERFLEWLGKPLGLPWWGVQLILYVGTVLAVFTFADVRFAYHRLGHWSVVLQLAAEFLFTAFMLWHLRQARAEALVVVAALGSGPERRQWLRRYLAPFNQGWHLTFSRTTAAGPGAARPGGARLGGAGPGGAGPGGTANLAVRGRNLPPRSETPATSDAPHGPPTNRRVGAHGLQPPAHPFCRPGSPTRRREPEICGPSAGESCWPGVSAPSDGPRAIWLRPWHLAILLLALYYGLVGYYALHPGALRPWSHAFPQLLLLYTHSAKALMMVAVLAHFWWLAGISQVATGAWPSALSPQRRAALLHTARQAALRLSVVTGCATGLWMFAYGLCFGVTWWAYLLSAAVLAVFLTQAITLSGRIATPSLLIASLALLGSLLGLGERARSLYRPAEAWAVAATVAWPVAANLLGGLAVTTVPS